MAWWPSAMRTISKPSASRTRLRTTSADGVLSIPARAATSEAVSSSSEKCAVIIIARLPLSQRFFGTDQGWIDKPAHLILMGLSRYAHDLGKNLADVFGCAESAALDLVNPPREKRFPLLDFRNPAQEKAFPSWDSPFPSL